MMTPLILADLTSEIPYSLNTQNCLGIVFVTVMKRMNMTVGMGFL